MIINSSKLGVKNKTKNTESEIFIVIQGLI